MLTSSQVIEKWWGADCISAQQCVSIGKGNQKKWHVCGVGQSITQQCLEVKLVHDHHRHLLLGLIKSLHRCLIINASASLIKAIEAIFKLTACGFIFTGSLFWKWERLGEAGVGWERRLLKDREAFDPSGWKWDCQMLLFGCFASFFLHFWAKLKSHGRIPLCYFGAEIIKALHVSLNYNTVCDAVRDSCLQGNKLCHKDVLTRNKTNSGCLDTWSHKNMGCYCLLGIESIFPSSASPIVSIKCCL